MLSAQTLRQCLLVLEPQTETGSRMLYFLAWFCFSPRTGKALLLISVVNVTNAMALKPAPNRKTSISGFVRGSKTSVLKLPIMNQYESRQIKLVPRVFSLPPKEPVIMIEVKSLNSFLRATELKVETSTLLRSSFHCVSEQL